MTSSVSTGTKLTAIYAKNARKKNHHIYKTNKFAFLFEKKKNKICKWKFEHKIMSLNNIRTGKKKDRLDCLRFCRAGQMKPSHENLCKPQ